MEHRPETTDPFEVVSAALPYVNGAPHIGHTLDIVHADALARCQRLLGVSTRLVTGTDENSLKNVRAAHARGVATAEHVAAHAARFAALARTLGASFDGFVRTSADPHHAATAARLFERCRARGDIYQHTYGGWFCVGCEQFYKADELRDGACPEHRVAPEWIEERNHFFRLSRYATELADAIAADVIAILPKERKAEVLTFIQAGLVDFSVSRSRARAGGWGIPVPSDADQVLFVWFDALAGYLSALETDGQPGEDVWRRARRRTHVIGKGITRFHALYWPAILRSAGLPWPDRICVHGYLTLQGHKISKSGGPVIDPFAILDKFGSDAVRYFLLRHVSSGADADFDLTRFETVYESELANQLGNLVQRVQGLLQRHTCGVVPAPRAASSSDAPLAAAALACAPELRVAVETYDLRRGLSAVWQLVTLCNRFIDHSEPWKLARGGDRSRLNDILYTSAETLRVIAVGLAPFLPSASSTILTRLGITTAPPDLQDLTWSPLRPGAPFSAGPPLFPKSSH